MCTVVWDSFINRFWFSAVFRRRVFTGASAHPWKIRKAPIAGVKKVKRENDEPGIRSRRGRVAIKNCPTFRRCSDSTPIVRTVLFSFSLPFLFFHSLPFFSPFCVEYFACQLLVTPVSNQLLASWRNPCGKIERYRIQLYHSLVSIVSNRNFFSFFFCFNSVLFFFLLYELQFILFERNEIEKNFKCL